MKKIGVLLCSIVVLASCVSKKKMTELQTKFEQQKEELYVTKTNLQKCLIDKEYLNGLKDQISDLKKDKSRALSQAENLSGTNQTLSENIKSVISQLSEKDKYINGIHKAMTQKDSLNLAIKYHLTKNLSQGIQDKDIMVEVEKTVVFISISDKLLFRSGSATITEKANSVLEKIATVINDQPDMDVMIEGHTDNTPISTKKFRDNWELSAERSISIIRKLQYNYGVDPTRLIAAGRSSYVPLVPNTSATNKAKNRRTKIIIMPQLDQFFDILEKKE